MHKKILKRKINILNPASNLLGVILSSFIGVGLSTLFILILSYIISKSSNLPSHTGAYFLACIGLGSVLSGIISSKKCNLKGLLAGLFCSIPNSIFVTIIMLFFTNGQLSESTIILYALIIICSTVGGIIGANTKKRK